MARTKNGQMVEKALASLEGDAQREKHKGLVVWLEEYRSRLQPEEAREVEVLLGVEPGPVDVPFRELVPDGWFADMLDLQAESEAPAPFYFLAALTVFSGLVGRKVMIDRGNHSIGIDCSALLISPAGAGRRSTACDFVVYQLGEPAGLEIIADSFTYEALGDALTKTAQDKEVTRPREVRLKKAKALIYAGEMAVLLGKGAYAESIIPKLTDLIGKTSRFNWQTLKHGKCEFINPCVNALWTSSPDWLVQNIPAVMFGGGTLSRILICVQDGADKVVTWAEQVSQEAVDALVAQLKERTDVEGTFPKPVGEAYEWYDRFYHRLRADVAGGKVPDDRMLPYYARRHDHLLRLAANLTIAAGDELVWTVERFAQAEKILQWLEIDIPKAYSTMSLSPLASALRKATEVLDGAGGTMERSRLQRKLYRECPLKEQFDGVMNALIDKGCVQALKALGGKTNYHLKRSLD